MEGREVDGGLADFHMSIGELTPFGTKGSVTACQFKSVEKYHVASKYLHLLNEASDRQIWDPHV